MIFGLFTRKKRLFDSDVMRGFNDYHTHSLPSVDDGVSSMREALDILEIYETMGVKRVVCTPHIMEDYPENTPANLRQRFAELQSQYGGGVELTLAAEYMLDSAFLSHLDSGELLPISEKHLLVETSYYGSANNLLETIDSIMARGYFVVLAHPERYLYMSKGDYKELKSRNVLFQLNLLSIVGAYGKEPQKRAKQLLKKGCYDLLGCDIHNLSYHRKYLIRLGVKRRYLDLMAQLAKREL